MRNFIKLLIRVVVTLGLLVWVISKVDIGGVCESVRQAKIWVVIGVWVLGVGVLWFESIKMRLILARQGCELKTSKVFGASAVSCLYSMVMPGSLSTGVKWYILKDDCGKGSNVFSCIVYNQLMEISILLGLGLGAFIARDSLNRWEVRIVLASVLVLAAWGYFLFLFSGPGVRANRFLRKFLRVFPNGMQKAGEKVFGQIETFQKLEWRFHLKIMIFTAVSLLVGGCGIYFLAAMAANISVPSAVLVWQCSLIYILGRIPISIGNLGIREAVLVAGLGVYGVEPAAVVLMSVIIFSNRVVMAGIGAVCQIAGGLRKSY